MLEVSIYDIIFLDSALENKKNMKINIFFTIEYENLLAFCRLFCFRNFKIKKTKGYFTIYFPVEEVATKGSEYILQLKL